MEDEPASEMEEDDVPPELPDELADSVSNNGVEQPDGATAQQPPNGATEQQLPDGTTEQQQHVPQQEHRLSGRGIDWFSYTF